MEGTLVKKKRGRPKTKEGKKVTFYLSNHTIAKLRLMTAINGNASRLIEELIDERHDATNQREGLDKG